MENAALRHCEITGEQIWWWGETEGWWCLLQLQLNNLTGKYWDCSTTADYIWSEIKRQVFIYFLLNYSQPSDSSPAELSVSGLASPDGAGSSGWSSTAPSSPSTAILFFTACSNTLGGQTGKQGSHLQRDSHLQHLEIFGISLVLTEGFHWK